MGELVAINVFVRAGCNEAVLAPLFFGSVWGIARGLVQDAARFWRRRAIWISLGAEFSLSSPAAITPPLVPPSRVSPPRCTGAVVPRRENPIALFVELRQGSNICGSTRSHPQRGSRCGPS
jgi:hypothetical protein